jgi:hypothetical protein
MPNKPRHLMAIILLFDFEIAPRRGCALTFSRNESNTDAYGSSG